MAGAHIAESIEASARVAVAEGHGRLPTGLPLCRWSDGQLQRRAIVYDVLIQTHAEAPPPIDMARHRARPIDPR